MFDGDESLGGCVVVDDGVGLFVNSIRSVVVVCRIKCFFLLFGGDFLDVLGGCGVFVGIVCVLLL